MVAIDVAQAPGNGPNTQLQIPGSRDSRSTEPTVGSRKLRGKDPCPILYSIGYSI